jgi:hypothetical protein
MAGGWTLLGAGVLLLRQRGASPFDSLWAEDGAVFLEDALTEGPLGAIVIPQAGYLHLVPRLLGALSAIVPLTEAPIALSGVSALLASTLSAYVYWASGDVLRSRVARAVVAGLMVLAPWAIHEVANNAANLNWYLTFACIWAFLRTTPSLAGAAISSIVVLAATLSTPIPLLLAPLATWRFLAGPSWSTRLVSVAWTVGAVIQIVVMALAPDTVGFIEFHPAALGAAYSVRVVGIVPFGNRFFDDAWQMLGWSFVWVALAVQALILACGSAWGERRHVVWIAVTALLSVLIFTVPVSVRGLSEALVPSEGFLNLAGARYTFVPLLLLATALVLSVQALARRMPRLGKRILVGASLVLLLALVVANLPFIRASGPTWRAELDQARTRCMDGPGTVVRVPITPKGSFIAVPCSRLGD